MHVQQLWCGEQSFSSSHLPQCSDLLPLTPECRTAGREGISQSMLYTRACRKAERKWIRQRMFVCLVAECKETGQIVGTVGVSFFYVISLYFICFWHPVMRDLMPCRLHPA